MGWRPTTQRICGDKSPAIVCVQVEPDRPLRFDLGGTSLVPGECALAPKKGGLVRVSVDDGRAHEVDLRWIRAPRGRVTWIGVRERKLRLRIDDREGCDRRVLDHELD
ncbi:MAG TPA: hypothetical protein ENK31_03230, partial [Nannocystis exedens]|nr:hypothetical protein [Nannocystis exedens]